MRRLWFGIVAAVVTSDWFMVLDGLFMSEKRWQKRQAHVRELGIRYGLPTDETGRSH